MWGKGVYYVGIFHCPVYTFISAAKDAKFLFPCAYAPLREVKHATKSVNYLWASVKDAIICILFPDNPRLCVQKSKRIILSQRE